MPNYHVVIDTNIYHKDQTRSKLPFQALTRLCCNGVVQLHVPYVVEREFQTQLLAACKEKLESTRKGLDYLIPYEQSAPRLERMKSMLDELTNMETEIIGNVGSSFSAWIKAVGGKHHAISEKNAKAAFDSYFDGSRPLTTPKVRADIPDSFIFQTIVDLAASSPPLFVISSDGKVADASASLDGVTVFKSLGDFVGSAQIQAEILHLDVVDNLPLIRSELSNYDEGTKELSSCIRLGGNEKIVWRKVYSHSIPDDNHEGTIESYYDPENIELDFEELAYFGNGEFGLPFNYITTVVIVYYIYKADYYALHEDISPSVTDHNDHYFEAEEEREVKVSGMLKLQIPIAVLDKISDEDALYGSVMVSIDSIDSIDLTQD